MTPLLAALGLTVHLICGAPEVVEAEYQGLSMMFKVQKSSRVEDNLTIEFRGTPKGREFYNLVVEEMSRIKQKIEFVRHDTGCS